MKKYGNKRIAAILLAVFVAFCFMPAAASGQAEVFAGESLTATKVVNETGLERGLTVLPDGRIYATSSGTIKGYTAAGAANGSVTLPTEYVGGLCNVEGYLFTNGFDASGSIYVIRAGYSTYKKVYAGFEIVNLTTDPYGNLYCVAGVKNTDTGKYETVVKKAKAADVIALSDGGTVSWTKTYKPGYTPLEGSNGNCYPKCIAVDGENNLYIADLGTSTGSSSNVSGIYKYDMDSGKITGIQFSDSSGVGKLNWIYNMAADDYGNVAVAGRNSSIVAYFRCDSTIADALLPTTGYTEAVALDAAGDLYYICNYGRDSGVFKVPTGCAAVTGVTLSLESKTIKVGGSFTLTGTVSPEDASNPHILYTTSNSSVATVTSTGKVTGKSPGTATITAKSVQGGHQASCTVTVEKIAITPTVTLSASTLVYNGKIRKPTVTVKNGGTKMDSSTYSVTYADGRKNVGKYKVTVKMKGNYSGTASKTFTIKPKKAVISKATPGTGQVKVTMSTKVSATGGGTYQIKYRVKGNSSWKTTTTTSQTKTIKSLKKGKRYEIKVRAYKKVNGATYYGAWSKVKTTDKVK